MLWLEVSHDEEHGGEGWRFGTCLWSPSRKRDGCSWPYWETLLAVEAGDDVVHVKGEGRNAKFVGTSVAAADGTETDARPPKPGQWDHDGTVYRVDLEDYSPLPEPIPLREFFSKYDRQLRDIFEKNKQSEHKVLLFFVIQGGRLQCQNGGYLTPVSEEIAGYIFRDQYANLTVEPSWISEISTSEHLHSVLARVGQSRFSRRVRENFGQKCCFPGCPIGDRHFLVAGHIDRWADDVERQRRGSIANGVCLCLMHDKAFETGYFTIDADHRVSVNRERVKDSDWAVANVQPQDGQRIKSSKIELDIEALERHWARIGYRPG